MNDMNRTKKQLIEEIADLREKIKDFKTAAANGPETSQALHPSEELYRLLVENASEAILVIQDKKIRYVNQTAIEITGYSGKELTAKSFIELIHPEDRHLIPDEAECHGQDKVATHHSTCRIVDRHQHIRWVEAKMMAIKDHSLAAFMCFLVDITERKMDEEALRSSEAKYRQLVEHAPAAIYEVDLTSGKLISVNDVCCEYMGYTKEEFLNLNFWDFLTEKSQHKQLIRYEKMLKGEPVSPEVEVEIVGKSGRIIPILAYTRLEYKDGQPFRAHTVAHNITDRKKMEEEFSKAQKLESLGVLAGGIGHDFNNLLSGIMGNISLAKLEAERGEDIMESLDEALRVASKASALTQQLLVFSKGGAPVKKAASIAEVLQDSTAFTLRGSRVKCKFNIAEDLWPVEVDIGQFSQVIHNLVINAMQAMSTGGELQLVAKNVTLVEKYDMPISPGRYVVIDIQDQGHGIAPEHLSKIFDPYFTTKSRGSGLGLAISYATIKRHDGHITVESSDHQGTNFRIYLPATEVQPQETTKRERRAVKGEGSVLVMDDEEILRKVAERMLVELGYEVQCAEDGKEAIEMYVEALQSGTSIDVVIMDLTVPGGLGGKETIKKLLQIDANAMAIVSSGYSNDPIMSNYEQFGFCGVVTKPYQIEELSWVMRDVLDAAKDRSARADIRL